MAVRKNKTAKTKSNNLMGWAVVMAIALVLFAAIGWIRWYQPNPIAGAAPGATNGNGTMIAGASLDGPQWQMPPNDLPNLPQGELVDLGTQGPAQANPLNSLASPGVISEGSLSVPALPSLGSVSPATSEQATVTNPSSLLPPLEALSSANDLASRDSMLPSAPQLPQLPGATPPVNLNLVHAVPHSNTSSPKSSVREGGLPSAHSSESTSGVVMVFPDANAVDVKAVDTYSNDIPIASREKLKIDLLNSDDVAVETLVASPHGASADVGAGSVLFKTIEPTKMQLNMEELANEKSPLTTIAQPWKIESESAETPSASSSMVEPGNLSGTSLTTSRPGVANQRIALNQNASRSTAEPKSGVKMTFQNQPARLAAHEPNMANSDVPSVPVSSKIEWNVGDQPRELPTPPSTLVRESLEPVLSKESSENLADKEPWAEPVREESRVEESLREESAREESAHEDSAHEDSARVEMQLSDRHVNAQPLTVLAIEPELDRVETPRVIKSTEARSEAENIGPSSRVRAIPSSNRPRTAVVQTPAQSMTHLSDEAESLDVQMEYHVAHRGTESVKLSQAIERVQVQDEKVCEVIMTSDNAFSIVGSRIGRTTAKIWLREPKPGQANPMTVSLDVQPYWQSENDRNLAGSVADLQKSINRLYPSSRVQVQLNPDGSLAVQGTATDEESAKQILTLVRKVCLVPVRDRLVVRVR